jgi:hypothetical protein
LTAPFQKALSIPATALAVVVVTALMVALSALWQWWKGRKKGAGIFTTETQRGFAASGQRSAASFWLRWLAAGRTRIFAARKDSDV